jgi:hypothetical protein
VFINKVLQGFIRSHSLVIGSRSRISTIVPRLPNLTSAYFYNFVMAKVVINGFVYRKNLPFSKVKKKQAVSDL